MTSWAGVERSLRFAQLSLASEPGVHLSSITKSAATRRQIEVKARYVERHFPRDGDALIFRAVLPIDLCPRMNELLRKHFAAKTTAGKKVFRELYRQNGFSRGELVGGRPLVRFVRFSTAATDDDASWTKVPLDVLVQNDDGRHMGFLRDDSRAETELRAWWEPGGAKCQLVYLDVWERKTRGR